MLQNEDSGVSISFPKTLVMLFKPSGSLCWHQKATAIAVIFTKSFSLLFAHEKLMFDWSSTCSLSRLQRELLIPIKRQSGMQFKVSRSLCCHQNASDIVVF